MIVDLRLYLLGKFLLTMRSQKYVLDHCNQSMRSGPNWKHVSKLSLQKKDLYVNRLESVIFSTECVFYRPELNETSGPHGTEIKFSKFKTEMYQRIEIKEYMRNMGSFVQLCLLPGLWSFKRQKWLDTFCWIQQKNQFQFGQDI